MKWLQFGYMEWINTFLKLIPSIYFYIFNVATKCLITYVAYIILLDRVTVELW